MASAAIKDKTKIKETLSRCCYLCWKKFPSSLLMFEHVALKHSYYKSPPKFMCTHCGDQCKSLENVVNHELKTHGLGYACQYCGMTCLGEQERIDHAISHHLKAAVHVCEVCKKEFQSVSDVELHIETHHTSKDEWIDCLKCRFCSDYFLKDKSLFNHVLKDHWQLFTCLCKSCGQLFHTMLALRRHRSDKNKCLDGEIVPVDPVVYKIKFELPSHADKANSFKNEMEEIMQTQATSGKKGSSKQSAGGSTSSPKPGPSTAACATSQDTVKSSPKKLTSQSFTSLKIKQEVRNPEVGRPATAETSATCQSRDTLITSQVVSDIKGETRKPGEEFTTVHTDIFNSSALREKQKNMLMKCCFICCKAFYNKDVMWQHMSSKHSYYVNPQEFTCTHCGAVAKTLDKLVQHELLDHGHSDACQFCGKRMKAEDERREHILAKHLEPDCKVCVECKKPFDSIKAIEKHMKSSHKGNKEWVSCYQCNFCDDLFKQKRTLFNHIFKDHWQLFTFLCKSCSQRFHSLLALQRHRSDRKNQLDDNLISTDVDSYVVKYGLPSHVEKCNSFSEEMEEILSSCTPTKKAKGKEPKPSTSKSVTMVDQKDLEKVLSE